MTIWANQSPIVLTDTIYTLYGGLTGSSVFAQRQAAYTIAEMAAQDDLDTFLLPTVVTGTYLYENEITLDHAFVTKVILARARDFSGNIQFTISGTNNWYLALRDDDYGIVDFGSLCHWVGYFYSPYSVDVVYEAGLPSGTTYTPNVLLALTTYAQITLNEIIGYGNESSGDIGVQKYSNQDYSEERIALFRSSFGSSPKGLFAHKLLTKYRRYRAVGLGKPVR